MKKICAVLLTIVLFFGNLPMEFLNFTVYAETGENIEAFYNGNGTVSDPYLIETKGQLNSVRGDLSAHYKLMADIVFSDEDFEEGGVFYNDGCGWEPIGSFASPFTGVFDGNSHSIKNLQIYTSADTDQEIGFFGNVSGEVKSLKLTGAVIVDSDVTESSIGTIAGVVDGKIIDCISECEVTVNHSVATTVLEDNYVYIGGIAGKLNGSVDGCTNNSVINVTSKPVNYIVTRGYIGGICGFSRGICTDSVNHGEITVQTMSKENTDTEAIYCAGGICGYLKSSIDSCTNTASVKMTDPRKSYNEYSFYVGGIVAAAETNTQILDCHNKGDVYAASYRAYSGGIVALTDGTVYWCSNGGNVCSASQYRDYAPPTCCGGIAGKSSGPIFECYNQGCIEWDQLGASQDTYVGGIVGYSTGNITNCYNSGHVAENMYYGYGGGIAGVSNGGTIQLCYDVGTAGMCAAIAGYSNIAPQDCLRTEHSFMAVSGVASNVPEYSLEQMQDASIFTNFDFEQIWELDVTAEYPFPVLKFNPHIKNKSENTTDFAGGDGSIENPYLIQTLEHLMNVEKYPRSNFKLIGDITAGNWVPIQNYGVFNGNGFTIFAYKIECNTEGGTGFISINEGCVIDLGVHVLEVGSWSANWIGGVVGLNFGKIQNCWFDGTVTNGGGIVGDAVGPVIGCSNYGTIYNGGGIAKDVSNYTSSAGTWLGVIENCVNWGNVSGDTVGGIVSNADRANVINCFNAGNVEGNTCAGGIVGTSSGDVINCYNVGDISGNNAGPIAGSFSGFFENCYCLDSPLISTQNIYEATVLTETEMSNKKSFKGYDFAKVWTMESTDEYIYPKLINCSSKTVNQIGTLSGSYGENIRWSLNGGGLLTISGTGDMSEISPESTWPWKQYSEYIRSVVVEPGITGIGEYAFSECEFITSVELPSGITSIGASAFAGCTKLTCLELPSGLTSIGEGAFGYCSSLTNITISTDSIHIGDLAFVFCSNLTSVTISGEIIYLGLGAFGFCEHLTNVNITEEITSVGPFLFWRCTSLTNIIIPEGVTSIEQAAFSECSNLLSVTLPTTIEYIADDAFDKCDNLKLYVSNTYAKNYAVGQNIPYETVTINLISIEATKLPTKLIYLEGESFDITGMVVTAYYNNNTSEIVTDYIVSGYTTTPGTKTITVTFEGRSATFTVEVNAKSLTHIEVTNIPAKTLFIVSQDELSVTGGKITLYYNNGTNEVIDMTTSMVSGFDNSVVGKANLTVNYDGKTTTYEIEIAEKTVISIAVTTKPNKLEYLEGDSFDKTGMVVTAYYNDNTSEVITDYTLSGYTSTPGSKTITVTYEGKTTSFTVVVKSKVPSTITSINYTVTGNSISKIVAGTTVDTLILGLNEGEFCKVYMDNTEVEGSTPIGTGMVVKIMDGDVEKASYTVIVTGDTNGDGDISIVDMIAIKAQLLQKSDLAGASAIAADTNGDGDISILDFMQVKAKILGKGEITPQSAPIADAV